MNEMQELLEAYGGFIATNKSDVVSKAQHSGLDLAVLYFRSDLYVSEAWYKGEWRILKNWINTEDIGLGERYLKEYGIIYPVPDEIVEAWNEVQ